MKVELLDNIMNIIVCQIFYSIVGNYGSKVLQSAFA